MTDVAVSPTSTYLRDALRNARALFTYGTLVQPRAYLLVAFVGYLLLGPVSAQTDIVAAVFCYSILGVLLLIALITVAEGFRIRRQLTVQLIDPSASRAEEDDSRPGITSRTPSGLGLRVSPYSVPPFFVLYLRLELEHGEIELPLHQLTGNSISASALREDITFPHRGLWKVRRARVHFGDQFGFTRDHWDIESADVARAITVHPPRVDTSTLPVLSSSFRSGEMMVDAVDNRGELFDIKRYHPSDGMQRIVWKIYARRGELMSRHPERAVTPEGQVVAFSLARTGEDQVCTQALAYLRYMEELDLLVWAGCRGMTGEHAGRSSEAIEKLFIETAWAADETSEERCRAELYGVIDEVQRSLSDAKLERVLLFCSAEEAASRVETLRRAGEALSARGIVPVFIVVSSDRLPMKAARPLPRWRRLAERALLFPDGTNGGGERPAAGSRELAQVCAARQWELIIA